jgi:hypothetical protein
MALLGTIGGIVGSIKAKKYSKKAAKAQIAAMQKGIGETQSQFDYTTGQYRPYTEAGAQALGQYGGLLGLSGPEQQQLAIDQVRQSPFYQSLYRTGLETNLQNASATGGIRGGNEVGSLYNLGEDTLLKAIEHQMAGLGGIANMGFSGVGQMAELGAGKAQQISGLYLGQGKAKAQDYATRGALTQNIWKGIGTAAEQGVQAAMGAGAGAGGMPFNFGKFVGNLGGYNG